MEEEQEWTRYRIVIPEDDWDEDDEIDARILKAERRRRSRISRGEGLRGI